MPAPRFVKYKNGQIGTDQFGDKKITKSTHRQSNKNPRRRRTQDIIRTLETEKIR